jgi:hypothetical protein
VLVTHLIISVGWIAALIGQKRVLRTLERIYPSARLLTLIFSGVVLFVFWFVPFEDQIKEYAALNWLILALILVCAPPAFRRISRLWAWLILVIGILLVGFMLLSSLAQLPFSPDEAHWADFASTAIIGGGIYARTWLMEPTPIIPGLGWSVGAYGWVLENILFDIRAGRLWNFGFYLLTVGMIGLLTNRLYGRTAAWVSMGFAVLSLAFFPAFDYRPHHQLGFAGALIVYAAVSARLTLRHGTIWHFVCGLTATLSLQLHAAGICFAFGIALYYLFEALGVLRRSGIKTATRCLIPFVIGAGIGTAIYFIFNIAPIGGVDAYLSGLVAERGERFNDGLTVLRWRSLLDFALLLSGFAFIIWRRSAADQLFLGMLICILIGFLLLDTQGYRTPTAALFTVPVGALFAHGFDALRDGERRNGIHHSAAALVVIAALIGQPLSWIAWDDISATIRERQLPVYLYNELRDIIPQYVTQDDIILGSHMMIWTFPDHPNLISVGAELNGIRRWELADPIEVWERVQPTVVITVQDEMSLNPGAVAYMERNAFQVCHQFVVQEKLIEILRPVCSAQNQ